jgi:predicted dithiol-disulfide oxidoreductase (DUF899 family)
MATATRSKRRSTSGVTRAEIMKAEKALMRQIDQVAKLRRKAAPEPVEDASFEAKGGETVRLSDLFGEKDELILVHNMGRSCVYCTFWADGFNGMLPHLEDRAAFAVVTPDPVEKQAEFAKGRGWGFTMVRDPKGRFSARMGYGSDDGIYPGCTTFRKLKDGTIERIASTPFGPGDLYNPAFHLFALLPGGTGDWGPRYKYR